MNHYNIPKKILLYPNSIYDNKAFLQQKKDSETERISTQSKPQIHFSHGNVIFDENFKQNFNNIIPTYFM